MHSVFKKTEEIQIKGPGIISLVCLSPVYGPQNGEQKDLGIAEGLRSWETVEWGQNKTDSPFQSLLWPLKETEQCKKDREKFPLPSKQQPSECFCSFKIPVGQGVTSSAGVPSLVLESGSPRKTWSLWKRHFLGPSFYTWAEKHRF